MIAARLARHPARPIAIVALALLAACGDVSTKTGSNGTGVVGPPTEPTAVAGTLLGAEPFTLGAAPLDASAASLLRDGTQASPEAALRLGMNLEAAGLSPRAYASGPTVLREASVQGAARGPVSAIDAANGTFRIATLSFTIDASTLFDGVAGLAGLQAGDVVDVHGLPGADPLTHRATRLTRLPGEDTRVSFTARVEEVSVSGLVLAGLSVATPGLAPAATLAGSRVRVTGALDASGTTLAADRIDVLPAHPPVAGALVEIEGIVTRLDGTGAFTLRTPGRDYDVAATPGAAIPASPGARVRVVGTATAANALAPSSLAVSRPDEAATYRLAGIVTEFASLSSLRVRGEPVDLASAIVTGGSAAQIANGRRVSLRGTAGPGYLRATEVALLP